MVYSFIYDVCQLSEQLEPRILLFFPQYVPKYKISLFRDHISLLKEDDMVDLHSL